MFSLYIASSLISLYLYLSSLSISFSLFILLSLYPSLSISFYLYILLSLYPSLSLSSSLYILLSLSPCVCWYMSKIEINKHPWYNRVSNSNLLSNYVYESAAFGLWAYLSRITNNNSFSIIVYNER